MRSVVVLSLAVLIHVVAQAPVAADASRFVNLVEPLVLAAKAKIDAKAASALVKRKYGGKVLSIKLIDSKGPPVYRVKNLSDDGVVKIVFVDGLSGKVFR